MRGGFFVYVLLKWQGRRAAVATPRVDRSHKIGEEITRGERTAQRAAVPAIGNYLVIL